MIRIVPAQADDDLAAAADLIRLYASTLAPHLGADGIAADADDLPGPYAPPNGAIFLARVAGEPAGIVALKRLEDGSCALKRMFVRQEYRGRGVTKALVRRLLATASRMGCRRVRLGTVEEMTAARRLYERMGFRPIPPYQSDPEDTLFYERVLPPRPRIKICCIMSEAEAGLALAAGADALGLVSHMPSGPGVIDEERIARIAVRVPEGVDSVLLTSLTEPGAIVAQHRRCGTTVIQLVDRLAPGAHEALRRALPDVRLWQVIHVTGDASVDEAMAAAPPVDALLLDSGNPSLAVKELGGTGRVHDWHVSRAIREQAGVPVYLAGGLDASNAAEALDRVEPFGLDVCSGVRTSGRLDPEKLEAFMLAAARLLP
ncbi:MAG: GNAT family N-acetyltransferase [Gemmatimonadota bacterium]